jgi:Protein of unknown function (DUF3309)
MSSATVCRIRTLGPRYRPIARRPVRDPLPADPAGLIVDAVCAVRHRSQIMSLSLVLIIILVIFLLGGFSGRFRGYGYGYGHSGVGIIGIVVIILVVLLLMGRI